MGAQASSTSGSCDEEIVADRGTLRGTRSPPQLPPKSSGSGGKKPACDLSPQADDDSVDDHEEAPTFAGRYLASLPHAEAIGQRLQPLRDKLAPCAAALEGPPPVLVELDCEASMGGESDGGVAGGDGAEVAGLTLSTSVFTGRVVVRRVAASSAALGLVSVGDTILEVRRQRARNATHAANLIRRHASSAAAGATPLELLVQPSQPRVARLLGADASDAAALARSRWRGSLATLCCAALLLQAVAAPAAWVQERQGRAGRLAEHRQWLLLDTTKTAQLAMAKAQLEAGERRHKRASEHATAAMQKAARVHLAELQRASRANATATARLAELESEHLKLRDELARERKAHRAAVAALRREGASASDLKKKQRELKDKFATTRQKLQQMWQASHAEMLRAVGELDGAVQEQQQQQQQREQQQ